MERADWHAVIRVRDALDCDALDCDESRRTGAGGFGGRLGHGGRSCRILESLANAQLRDNCAGRGKMSGIWL